MLHKTYDSSLALDADDHPHIIYYDLANRDLKYAYYDGTSWQITIIDSEVGFDGVRSDLVLEQGGRPHLCYNNRVTQDLNYAYLNGAVWQIETVESAGSVGSYCSIVLDPAGHPHISYFKASSSKLGYAHYDGTNWQVEIVDSLSYGKYTSLALDISNHPHISYYDANKRHLKYAFQENTGWQIEKIDSTLGSSSSSGPSSLILDPGNRPHIAYSDDGKLKYAVAPTNLTFWSRIAFASYRDMNWEIYSSRGDGAWWSRLTIHGATDSRPEFNRGCTQIAFYSARDGNYEIYKMNADGSNQTRLTWTFFNEYQPTWSPDGSQIASYGYPDTETNGEIYVMNADGSSQMRLTWIPAWDGHPTWSPDGSKIAFVSNRSGNYELWTMNPDGSNQQQLSAGLSFAAYPDWSPDGSRIAFNDDYNGDGWFDLALINTNGTSLSHPLESSPSEYDHLAPAWAPHGKDLAFAKVQYIFYQGNWYWVDAYIYGLDLGTQATYLLVDSGYEWWPDWQSTDTVAPSSQVATLPTWSPISFTVQWSGNDSGGAGVHSYDVQFKDGASGAWTDWLLDTTQTAAVFTGESGHSYYFQSRARDYAYHVEPYPGGNGDTHTQIDTTLPQSLASSPLYIGTAAFTVTWSGWDQGGSGIASYDLQYKDGTRGVWTDWLVQTTALSATFTGDDSHTYYFQSRARDNIGNLEDYPGDNGDTQTLVDMTPPTSAASSPEHASAPRFVVSWSGDDGTGSGIASYDVQFRDGPSGTWTDWRIETTYESGTFVGESGHRYYFQSRARDQLDNLEVYPGGDGDTVTETPQHVLSGYVLGNREQPIAFVTVQATPPLSNTAQSGFDGAFSLYYNVTGTVALSVSRSGFGALPPMQGVSLRTSPADVVFYLPPMDDRVSDGGFESGDLTAWRLAGEIPPKISTSAHTGDWAAALGGAAPEPVVTPTPAFSATGTFTQAGGVLTSTWVTAEMPPAAVSGTVVLALTGVPTVTGLPTDTQDVGPHLAWSAALTDGTPVTTTLLPLTLTVNYEDSAWQAAQVAGEDSLALWRYDPLSATWVPLSGALDTLSNTIVVAMAEPSILALLGAPYAGPWHGLLEQELVLSPTMTLETLSLLYQVEGVTLTSETLHLTLACMTQTVSYTLPLTVNGWIHRWWILPSWAGPTMTLRLEWSQGSRQGSGHVILDEVSLGAVATGSYPIYIPLILKQFD